MLFNDSVRFSQHVGRILTILDCRFPILDSTIIELPAQLEPKHIRRNCYADLLCCFQIDEKLKLDGSFHGQVGGPGAIKDLIYERGGTPVLIDSVRP